MLLLSAKLNDLFIILYVFLNLIVGDIISLFNLINFLDTNRLNILLKSSLFKPDTVINSFLFTLELLAKKSINVTFLGYIVSSSLVSFSTTET